MSKLPLETLIKARDGADGLLKSNAYDHGQDAINEMWRWFNEDEATPAIVKAMADELIELRQRHERVALKQAGLHQVAKTDVGGLIDMATYRRAEDRDTLIAIATSRHASDNTTWPVSDTDNVMRNGLKPVCECLTEFRGQCVECGKPLPADESQSLEYCGLEITKESIGCAKLTAYMAGKVTPPFEILSRRGHQWHRVEVVTSDINGYLMFMDGTAVMRRVKPTGIVMVRKGA